jgi:hypothetical protein
MQVQILVACKSGPSLRRAIGADARIEAHGLTVTEQQRPGRRGGWTKVYSSSYDKYGAINLHWDSHSALLICRVVTKQGHKPGPLIGTFVGYLLSKYRSQIQSVTIIL